MTLNRQQRRENERAARAAAARAARAAADPVAMARDNANYERELQIAESIIEALVRHMGVEEVTVPRADWKAPPPDKHLSVTLDPEENAIVALHPGRRGSCEECTKRPT